MGCQDNYAHAHTVYTRLYFPPKSLGMGQSTMLPGSWVNDMIRALGQLLWEKYNCHHFLHRWRQTLGPPCTWMRATCTYFGHVMSWYGYSLTDTIYSTDLCRQLDIRGEHIHGTGDLVHVGGIPPLLYCMLRIGHPIVRVKVHHTHLDRKSYTQECETHECD